MQDDTEAGIDAGRRDRDKGPGETLRRAREAQGLSIEQVAQDLHLDIWVIEALEADDFASLGAPVFAKGHLRKYAATLGLATDDLLAAYYQVHRVRESVPLVAGWRGRGRKGRRPWALPILILLLLAAGAASAWWLARHWGPSDQQAEPKPPVAERTALEESPAPLESMVSRPFSEVPREPLIDEPSPEAVVAREPTMVEPVADPLPVELAPVEAAGQDLEVEGAVAVTLRFVQDSWVEIHDANGERLMFGLGRSGSERRLVGAPPLDVFLGYANGVEISVAGEPFPVSGRRGNVARFEIAQRPAQP